MQLLAAAVVVRWLGAALQDKRGALWSALLGNLPS
jgi:hypothetical protein